MVFLWINPSLLNLLSVENSNIRNLINDKLPPEQSLLATQNETQLASSGTWAWWYQFSAIRL